MKECNPAAGWFGKKSVHTVLRRLIVGMEIVDVRRASA